MNDRTNGGKNNVAHAYYIYECMLLSNRTEPNRAQHINDYMIVMMGLLSMENDTPMSDRALFKFIRFSLTRVSMNEKFDEIVNSFAFIFHSQTNCL